MNYLTPVKSRVGIFFVFCTDMERTSLLMRFFQFRKREEKRKEKKEMKKEMKKEKTLHLVEMFLQLRPTISRLNFNQFCLQLREILPHSAIYNVVDSPGGSTA